MGSGMGRDVWTLTPTQITNTAKVSVDHKAGLNIDQYRLILTVYLGHSSMVYPSHHPNQSGHRVFLHADLPRAPIPTAMPRHYHPLLLVHDINVYYRDSVLHPRGGRLDELERRVECNMLR